MTITLPGIVYLAGPIDLVSVTKARHWREIATDRLSSAGYSIYNPVGAFFVSTLTRPVAKSIVSINNNAMRHSHLFLFAIDDETPSIGTPMELLMLHEQRRINDVFVWYTKKKSKPIPAYLQAHVREDRLFDTLEEAIDAIKAHDQLQ